MEINMRWSFLLISKYSPYVLLLYIKIYNKNESDDKIYESRKNRKIYCKVNKRKMINTIRIV